MRMTVVIKKAVTSKSSLFMYHITVIFHVTVIIEGLMPWTDQIITVSGQIVISNCQMLKYAQYRSHFDRYHPNHSHTTNF